MDTNRLIVPNVLCVSIVTREVTSHGTADIGRNLSVCLKETIQDPRLSRIPYAEIISHCGGTQTVTSAILESIDPAVRALEGKEITTRQLDEIFLTQSRERNCWPKNSGYLNFVKDDRDEKYWRPYVGQSENPLLRIKQHKNIINLACDTLHYYVIWKGDGHRWANFIRLWTLILPEGMDESIHIVFNNKYPRNGDGSCISIASPENPGNMVWPYE
ncbi:hypothetical protein T310_3382 [Rasamsonia emersonii CBS 393.64]|uniref:Uncharacterized protein n=1 Tax=Rasamsonia emersonii (strain ATCC 16479 / CBS 393.64 / IMI 116815) TaxID=1408163 RepID=A0A0F4YXL7_RASE3|nr:hypothetical protein T310_3382 [Rasamsonia emersonii CBS 393.64]KKA22591.1 hypothetical protein T310_3382 [Rasamsonia emersonii CBS 393.64]